MTTQELRVCTGSSCLSLGSNTFVKNLNSEITDRNLTATCKVKCVGCNGLCAHGILVSHKNEKTNEEILYEKITTLDAKSLTDCIQNNTLLEDKICDTNQHFFTKQTKIVLRNVGKIDPDDIEDYIANDGYTTLFSILSDKSPSDVINELKISKLRGRGGAGFPTGQKWEAVAKVPSEIKYIICNADEGDPGAFMDRAIMEADPHSVLEGMAIAGYACGANYGFIYIRAEYPLAIEKLHRAIDQARAKGMLGNKIAHSHFNFDIEIRLGAGAYVCGESTALVASIEGSRGNPRQTPPHQSDHGLWGYPTAVNNVETLANIVPIMKNGGEWFSKIGTTCSTGTKVFALTGHIKHTGLVEVAMGITLRELIYDIGGGIADGKKLKAIQMEGPGGGCIPPSLLDITVDFDSFKSIDTIMGSGGIIVIDESSNMVEIAHYFMDFCKSESCGKCTPCRVGTVSLANLLDKFIKKEATHADLELLQNISEVVKETSLCGLGQNAPDSVLSTLKYFKNEYLEGIKND